MAAGVRMLGQQGGVLDTAADLYDIAFVMLAMAWFSRATGDAEPLRQAKQTLDWVRANMAVPGGGYHNAVPWEAGHRGQNPHMHLLEASLALYEASGDEAYAALAHELVGLFRSHFHHAESGTLGEFFDDLLQPAEADAGSHVEPGHQYEWVWLLEQYARLLGGDVAAESQRLYNFAEVYGRDSSGVPVLDAIGRDGAVRHGTARLWPQTEALKAHATHDAPRPRCRRADGSRPDLSTRSLPERLPAGHVAGPVRARRWREYRNEDPGQFPLPYLRGVRRFGQIDRL